MLAVTIPLVIGYWLPSFVAIVRRHQSWCAIVAFNLRLDMAPASRSGPAWSSWRYRLREGATTLHHAPDQETALPYIGEQSTTLCDRWQRATAFLQFRR